MRASDILIIVWFFIVITMDKFVHSYYYIALLLISGIFLFAIHKFNMKEKAEIIGKTK
jgi:hypothetical protein